LIFCSVPCGSKTLIKGREQWGGGRRPNEKEIFFYSQRKEKRGKKEVHSIADVDGTIGGRKSDDLKKERPWLMT